MEKKFKTFDGSKLRDVVECTFYGQNRYRINDDVKSHYEQYPLLQYTGVKDKFDQEIYECDILKIHGHETLCSISYDLGFAGYSANNKEFGYRLSNFRPSDLEKIGNLYTNPELIK